MKFYRKKHNILLALLIMLSLLLFSQVAFAEANDTAVNSDSEVEVLSSEYCDVNKISTDNSQNELSDSKNTTLFIISDNPGTNILDKAAWELHDEKKLDNVNLIIRGVELSDILADKRFSAFVYLPDKRARAATKRHGPANQGKRINESFQFTRDYQSTRGTQTFILPASRLSQE